MGRDVVEGQLERHLVIEFFTQRPAFFVKLQAQVIVPERAVSQTHAVEDQGGKLSIADLFISRQTLFVVLQRLLELSLRRVSIPDGIQRLRLPSLVASLFSNGEALLKRTEPFSAAILTAVYGSKIT